MNIEDWKNNNPLRKFRKNNKCAQTQIAAMLGVSVTTIRLWESGSMTPSEENFEKIKKLTEKDNIKEEWSCWFEMVS